MKSSTGLIRSELLPAHLRRPGAAQGQAWTARSVPVLLRGGTSHRTSHRMSQRTSQTISCCSEWRNQRRLIGPTMVLQQDSRTPGRVLVLQLMGGVQTPDAAFGDVNLLHQETLMSFI